MVSSRRISPAVNDRARRAVSEFRKVQPTLTAFARVLTGNPKVNVIAKAGTPYTDGKNIFIQPPIELGDRREHDRSVCDRRDWETLQQQCPACETREEVMATTYHEISHMAFESFTPPDDMQLKEALGYIRQVSNPKQAERIIRRVLADAEIPKSYMALASVINPYFKLLANCLEDVRINARMHKARPGTKPMMDSQILRVMSNGVEQPNGKVLRWTEQHLNNQASIGAYLLAGGFEPEVGWLADEVLTQLKDEELRRILLGVTEAADAHEAFQISWLTFMRLRELGFYQLKEEEQDDEPEEDADEADNPPAPPTPPTPPRPQPEQSAGDADEDDASDDDSAPGGDADAQDDTESSSDSDDAEDEENEQPEADSGPEADADETPDEQESGSDQPSEDAGDDASADEPSDEETEGASSDDSDEELGDEESEPSDGGADDSDTDGEAEDTESDGDPEGEPEPGDEEPVEAGDDGDEIDDSENHESGEPEEPDDEDGPAAGRGDGGEGGDSTFHVEPSEEAEEAELDLGDLGLHQHTEEPDAQTEKALEVAIVQEEYFDKPSANIGGVMEWHFDTAETDRRGRFWHAWDRFNDGGLELPSETIMGPALMRMRLVFAANKRAQRNRNQRSGRLETRALGKRAPFGDDRLFGKKVIPNRRDYIVDIYIDVSGSTSFGSPTRNIDLIKDAAYAQGELCARMGVKFRMFAHTGSPRSESERRGHGSTDWLDIYHIKGENEPWDDKIKQRLMAIGPSYQNLDGHALEFARKHIENHSATDKVILYYSDGQMPMENYAEELSILQREIGICKQKGITLLGVGIRTDSPARHGLDTVQVDDSSDIGRVVQHLERCLVA